MFFTQKRLPKLAGLAAALLLAACSAGQDATAPIATPNATSAVQAPAMPSVVASGATRAAQVERPANGDLRHSTMSVVYPSNAVTYQFTVTPTQSMSFIVGMHMVSFPAYTICDPATSGYGASTWLTSCTKLTQPIVITAITWVDVFGRAQIDFANSIRFYPNNNAQLPAIYLRDPWAAASQMGRIDYCVATNSCVNEASSDATLVTQRDPITGYLFRLIRHFSGYNVWA